MTRTTEFKREVRVGSYGEGHGRIAVRVEARIERSNREVETVDHQKVTGLARVSITGRHAKRGRTGGGGQIIDEVRKVTDFSPGWDAAKRDRLVEIWERWHLNDLQAGCAHQEPIGVDIGERLDKTPPCPETGYEYGHAWLVEIVPDEVLDELKELMSA